MSQYTEEDKKAFKLKDLLNSKMSALKAASIINEGNSTISVKEVLEQAQGYFEWLTAGQDFSDLKSSKEPAAKKEINKKSTLPAPNLAQKKVLDYVAKQLNLEVNDELKQDVLNYIEKEFGKRIYPGKKESIENFINERKTK